MSTVYYYDPFADFNRLFDQAFTTWSAGNSGQRRVEGSEGTQQVAGPGFRPRLDLHEDTEKNVVTVTVELPGLKKELVFIKQVRNSHAVIIARDVKRFPGHKDGEGVLRHWADHFIM